MKWGFMGKNKISFQDDNNFMELDGVGGCTTLCMY